MANPAPCPGKRRYTVPMKLRSVWICLSFALAALPAMAQWQWVEKDGRKVYSDRAPPPDVPEKSILKRPGGAARPAADAAEPAPAAKPAVSIATPAASGAGVDKDLEAKKKAAADAEAAKAKATEAAQAKTMADNCRTARQAKANLDAGIRMSRINEKGEREVLDDAARAEELRRVQANIDSNCK